MRARFFFPGGLDPVLNRGPGDEDPVVAPQVPACRSIRQSVFDDHAYGRLLHAVRITTLRERQVGHVGVEGASAAAATVFGVGNHDVDRAAGAGIAEIMEGPGCHVTARRRASAARTGATPRVTSAALDMRRRQVLHPRDTFGGIRDIVARPIHNALLLIKPPTIAAILRSEERIAYHFVATVSKKLPLLPLRAIFSRDL
jgi:hypothetical protein